MSTAKKLRHERRPKVIRARAAALAWTFTLSHHFGFVRPKRRTWKPKKTTMFGGIDPSGYSRWEAVKTTHDGSLDSPTIRDLRGAMETTNFRP